jgi:hypothetical protein
MKSIKQSGFNKHKVLELPSINVIRDSRMDKLIRKFLFIQISINEHMPRLNFGNSNGAKWSKFIDSKHYKKVI